MDFDEGRRRKWMAGRRERGLPLDAPFDGDPVAEMPGECFDLANYAEQALVEGRMPAEVVQKIYEDARGAWTIINAYLDVHFTHE